MVWSQDILSSHTDTSQYRVLLIESGVNHTQVLISVSWLPVEAGGKTAVLFS